MHPGSLAAPAPKSVLPVAVVVDLVGALGRRLDNLGAPPKSKLLSKVISSKLLSMTWANRKAGPGKLGASSWTVTGADAPAASSGRVHCVQSKPKKTQSQPSPLTTTFVEPDGVKMSRTTPKESEPPWFVTSTV